MMMRASHQAEESKSTCRTSSRDAAPLNRPAENSLPWSRSCHRAPQGWAAHDAYTTGWRRSAASVAVVPAATRARVSPLSP